MTRYVIGPDVALRLAAQRAELRAEVKLLAPTLMRSELLDLLFQAVREGKMSKADADELGCSGTFDAEYIALTRLQADALVTTSSRLRAVARRFVSVAPVKALR